jgi:hypothetical protein
MQPREATAVRTVPWWVGPAFAVLALATVPWVVFLAITLLSLVLAGLVELPLAAICLWIALHAEQVIQNRVVILARRARRAERRLARRDG